MHPGHDVLRIDRDDDIKSGTLLTSPLLFAVGLGVFGASFGLRKWR